VARFTKQYRKLAGEHGTFVIEETGLCLTSDVPGIEAGCCKRYRMVPIPGGSGAILKVLDGVTPMISWITLSTLGRSYYCAKVYGEVNPYAPEQLGGALEGRTVLQYVMRWQQVGGVA
jgi:hypothetical protein